MLRNILAVSLTALASGYGFAQVSKPEDIVKKAIEAIGGAEVINKYPAGTTTMKGTLTLAGQEFPFTGAMAFSIPDKVRLEITADVLGQKAIIIQLVNGDKVRQIQNGQPVPLSDAARDEIKQTPALQELSLLTPLLDAKRYTLSLAKDETGGGKTVAIEVRGNGLKDITLFFDAKTSMPLRMRRKAISPEMKSVTEDLVFDDYQKVSGIMVPMKSTVTHDGKPFMTFTLSEYKPLEKIDDKEFTIAD